MLLLLVILVGGGAVFFWLTVKRSAPESQPGITPEVTATASPDITPVADNSTPPVGSGVSPTPVKYSVPSSTPAPAKNLTDEKLAVTISFTRTPNFAISITDVEKTTNQQTVQHYLPRDGAPYSILRITNQAGNTIYETQFSLTTQVALEEVDPQTSQERSVYDLPSGSAYLVLPPSFGDPPAGVVVLNAQGQIIDRRSFDFSALKSDKTSGSLVQTIKKFAQRILPRRYADAQAGGKFTIAVISEKGAEKYVEESARDTRAMLSIEPWATFANRVEVIPIVNSQPLGCVLIELLPGVAFPQCPNDGQVIAAVEQEVPQWDAIVVVYPYSCKCGSVGLNFPPITTVGYNSTPALIVHELGHAIGKMKDEYLYKYGAIGNPPGENCFLTRDECLAAIEELPGEGAECREGCADIYQWRPANRIMHNSYVPLRFGPVEKCIMGQAIASIIGASYNCQ